MMSAVESTVWECDSMPQLEYKWKNTVGAFGLWLHCPLSLNTTKWLHLMRSFLLRTLQTNHDANIKGVLYILLACGSCLHCTASQLPLCIPCCICFVTWGIYYIFTFLRQENPLNISEAGSCLTWSNIALQSFLYTSQGFISDSLAF